MKTYQDPTTYIEQKSILFLFLSNSLLLHPKWAADEGAAPKVVVDEIAAGLISGEATNMEPCPMKPPPKS